MRMLGQHQRGDADDRRASTTTSDPLSTSYVWQSPGKQFEHQPTSGSTTTSTDNHRLSGTFSADLWRRAIRTI